MLVATFGPTTTWVDKTVTCADGAFVLEGHGPIRAKGVFEYERQGQLVWPMDGIRAWGGARAQAEGGVAAAPSQTPEWRADRPATAEPDQPATLEPQEPTVESPQAEAVQETIQPEAAGLVPPTASAPPADLVRESPPLGARRRLLSQRVRG
jgi:hypothetical protein